MYVVALCKYVANMSFVTISMNLSTEAKANDLSTFMETEIGVKTEVVFNHGTRSSTTKLQTWKARSARR